MQLQIYNSTGQLVFSLIGQVGETVSGASVLLTPGQYQVLFSVVNTGDGTWPTIDYLPARGQPLGPHRSGPCRPDERADVSVPERPFGLLLLLPQRNLFPGPLRSLEHELISNNQHFIVIIRRR